MASHNHYRQTIAGKRFRTHLDKCDLSRQEFADLTNVHLTTLNYWLKRGVTKRSVSAAAELLDVEADKIVNSSKQTRVYQKVAKDKAAKIAADKAAKLSKINKNHADLYQPNYNELAARRPSAHKPLYLDLLNLITSKKLTAQQEQVVLNLANTFVQENQHDASMQSNG